MPKLIYWVATQDDHPCYHIRAKTKKEVQAAIARINADTEWKTHFSAPQKVEVEYTNGFDLLMKCVAGEDAIFWEPTHDRFR